MIKILLFGLSFLCFTSFLPAEAKSKASTNPAIIELRDLQFNPSHFPQKRRDFLFQTISLMQKHQKKPLRYLYGSHEPSRGGLDCSGATFHLFNQVQIKAPRTSSQQFDWLQKTGILHPFPSKVKTLESPYFNKLLPGDLLFWGGTYHPKDGRKNRVTHVAIYLGKHRKTGKHLMANASSGRSYEGRKTKGYGVVNFRLPSSRSKSFFLGYGHPAEFKE